MWFLVIAFIPTTESKQGQLLPPFVCLFLCGGAQRPEKDISTLFCYCPPYFLERGCLTEPGAMLMASELQ